MQPPSWRDTICDVCELVGTKDLDEVPEDCGLDQIRVELCDTVDLVGSNDGKVRHANHLGLTLLNDGYPAEKIAVSRELALY